MSTKDMQWWRALSPDGAALEVEAQEFRSVAAPIFATMQDKMIHLKDKELDERWFVLNKASYPEYCGHITRLCQHLTSDEVNTLLRTYIIQKYALPSTGRCYANSTMREGMDIHKLLQKLAIPSKTFSEIHATPHLALPSTLWNDNNLYQEPGQWETMVVVYERNHPTQEGRAKQWEKHIAFPRSIHDLYQCQLYLRDFTCTIYLVNRDLIWSEGPAMLSLSKMLLDNKMSQESKATSN